MNGLHPQWLSVRAELHSPTRSAIPIQSSLIGNAGRRVRVVEFLYPSTKSVSKAVEDHTGLLGVDDQHVVADLVGRRLALAVEGSESLFELLSTNGP